jgi:hypothetical protein
VSYNKKILVSEQDKSHILSLYGLLKEDNTPNPQPSSFKVDKTINFAPGYYRLKGPVTTKAGSTYNWDVSTTLNADLLKIKEFLKNNPTGYVVEVNLYSGESLIPNSDNEKGGIPLKTGQLSAARMNSLKTYLTPIFESWKNEGITKTPFKINEIPQPGKTPWKGTPFCPASVGDERSCSTTYYNKVKAGDKVALDYKQKYDAEQYFRVVIEVKKVEPTTQPVPSPTGQTETVTEGCAEGLEITVYVKTHQCQNAEYLVYANSTLLTNLAGGNTANLNNADTFMDAKAFNFPVEADGSVLMTHETEGYQTTLFKSNSAIPAQIINPAYGFTKNGPYRPNPDGDTSGQRMDTFKVTAEQSKTITAQGKGEINIWLIGTTKSMHLDIPYVLIRKGGKEVYNAQPKVEQGLVLTLSGCGSKVSTSKNTGAAKPTGYQSILVKLFKERVEKLKQGLGANAATELTKKQTRDNKSIILDRVKQLSDIMDEVIAMGANIGKSVFPEGQAMTNAMYKELGRQWNSKANSVARMNLYNQMQTFMDGPPSFRKNPNGTYVDTNIEKSKKNPEKSLMGDVLMKLEDFYKKFDKIYKTDDGQYVPNGITYEQASESPRGVGPLIGRV